jgi:hypothetical protein
VLCGEFLDKDRQLCDIIQGFVLTSDPPMKIASRRGVILVIVLVVVVLLTLSVLTFSKFMIAQRRGTNMSLRQTQARLLAESGIEYLRNLLFKDQLTILEYGGLYDNSDEFCGHIVTDGTISMTGIAAGTQTSLSNIDLRDVGRFSVIAPALSDDGILTGDQIRFGLEDESCKINLRWILQTEIQQPGYGRTILMRLPGVNEEIADAILDWIDEDNEPREFGAEDDYYTGLDPPYYTRNRIPDSLDELLLVRGMTPQLLYGIDWNRNGIADLGEPNESSLDEFNRTDGSLNLGLIAYLTLDSRESMVTPDGLDKINVNMDDLEELRSLLEERFEDSTWIDYIISYRQNGGVTAASGGNTGSGSGGSSATAATVNSILDLVGGSGSPFADDLDAMNEYLPLLYDNLMISNTPVAGRININQAPRTVLELFAAQDDALIDSAFLLGTETDTANQLLGGETSLSQLNVTEIIEGILAERISDPNLIESPEMNYPFWIYTHNIVTDLAVMKQLEPYFCTQGAVFKAMVVGRFDEQSPVSRLEVWLDAAEAGKPAKVIRIRDVSDLGPGYTAELLRADEQAR